MAGSRADLAAGKISPEAVNKAFSQLNATETQLAPDMRSDEAKALDTAFPPAGPQEFTIRYNAPGDDALTMSPGMKVFDQSARTWLSGAQFPRDLGNTLVNTITKVMQTTKSMTPDQLNDYSTREYAKLEKAFGSTLDDKLRAAGHMVEALDTKTPGLKNLLRARGIGDNALIASMLIQQAERFHARNKGRS